GRQILQLLKNLLKPHSPKAEVLTTRPNGLRDVLWLRGRQHKHHMPRWLLERFQKGVEGGVSNLVGFVVNVGLIAIACWTIQGSFTYFSNFVDAAVRCRMNYDHVDRISCANLRTGFTHAAGFWHRVVLGPAIQGHSQDTGARGFANSPVSAEDVAVCRPTLLNCILKRVGDVFLSNDLRELLGAVLTGQDLVAHGKL